MKNKLGVDFTASDKFVGGELALTVEVQRGRKVSSRRESVTPKIVVCPPVEDMTEPMTRGNRVLKALSSRLLRHGTDAESVDSSSSSESMSCRNEDRSSCSTSDSGSDNSEANRRHRSVISLRRVFQSLNLSSRSQSCSPTDRQRQPKKQPQPKRILRPPITYTYARGLSGLPTQRIPRYATSCTSMGLNR